MLGGDDPYSASKSAAEIAINSYYNSFLKKKKNIKLGIARAGNVIGGGDRSRNRLVPDCVKFIETGKTIEIRSPKSVRPWQHVIEPVGGYLLLGAKMLSDRTSLNQAWNFGPESHNIVTVKKLVSKNRLVFN